MSLEDYERIKAVVKSREGRAAHGLVFTHKWARIAALDTLAVSLMGLMGDSLFHQITDVNEAGEIVQVFRLNTPVIESIRGLINDVERELGTQPAPPINEPGTFSPCLN